MRPPGDRIHPVPVGFPAVAESNTKYNYYNKQISLFINLFYVYCKKDIKHIKNKHTEPESSNIFLQDVGKNGRVI